MKRNRRTLAAVLAAAAFTLGAAGASAQPRGDHGPQRHERFDRDGRGDAQRHGPQARRGGPEHAHRPWQDRRDHRHAAAARGPGPHWQARGRGAGPRHDLYVGRLAPAYYRTPHYVVRDWHVHRLAAPPRGYHWVQAGADYLLVAIGSGMIAQVVLAW